MMVVASCQDVAEDTTQSEAVAVESGYPSLHTVPPRPQLSYTVEQRRAIVDGLIADRENARYSSDVARYRTGLSSLPPPEAPAVVTPLEAAPEPAEAADASAPPRAVRDRPAIPPETEYRYEDDDDLGSFMEEMVGGGVAPQGEIAPAPGGPESNAAPLHSGILRASAVRPVSSAAAYDGRPPGVVWAIPTDTASLPDEPIPTATPATGTRQAVLSPTPIETALAGRAPGVVWGRPDMAKAPPGPSSAATATRAAGTRAASRPAPTAMPGKPAAAAPIETAGRAPGVVWGRPDMADQPAEPTSNATATRAAGTGAVPPTGSPAAPIETTEQPVQSVATVLAGRPSPQALLEPGAGAAVIEVADGRIAIEPAASEAPDRALGSVVFGPGSAALSPDATARLEQFLTAAKAPDARIRIVGEAAAPALALDRALAVGLALVQSGVPAGRLELTMARDAAGDQARLFLAAPAP